VVVGVLFLFGHQIFKATFQACLYIAKMKKLNICLSIHYNRKRKLAINYVTLSYCSPHFKWNFLNDSDDKKFIDFAISGNADFIISNDNGFNVLKSIEFPPIQLITSQEFEEKFKDNFTI